MDLVEPASLLITGRKGHAVIRNAPGMPQQRLGQQLFLLTDAVDGVTAKEPWADLAEALPRPPEQFIDAVAHGKRDHLVSVREAAYSSYVMEMISSAAAERRWMPINPTAL